MVKISNIVGQEFEIIFAVNVWSFGHVTLRDKSLSSTKFLSCEKQRENVGKQAGIMPIRFIFLIGAFRSASLYKFCLCQLFRSVSDFYSPRIVTRKKL